MVSSPFLLITGGPIDSHSNAHLLSFPAILLKSPCSSSTQLCPSSISQQKTALHRSTRGTDPSASPAGSAPPSVERRSLSPTLAGRSAAGCARGCGAPDTSTCAAAVRDAETSMVDLEKWEICGDQFNEDAVLMSCSCFEANKQIG